MSDSPSTPDPDDGGLDVPTSPLLMVDGRCHCNRCTSRTEDIYRMVGHCTNCGARPILILYRAGDKAGDKDCPSCGVWHSVSPDRLAIADEIPTYADAPGGAE